MKTITFEGLGDHAFEDDRLGLKSEGKLHAFDDPNFSEATILLVNKNFGCGSSREHAPQAIVRWGKGVVVVVGESFAEIFYGNCQTLGVPCPTVSADVIEKAMSKIEAEPSTLVSVDLEKRELRVGSDAYPLSIPDGPRRAFLDGSWDSTGELLSAEAAIRKTANSLGYISGYAS